MIQLNRKLPLLIFFIFQSVFSFAAKISGKITEENGEALPFANVYISGTTTGTTANLDGYYTIELKPGTYDFTFRLVGYKIEHKRIVVGTDDQVINMIMNREALKLKEVTVTAGREDPAYEIIRQAQKKRKYYLDRVKKFTCNAYVKSTQKLVSYPKTFMGSKVDFSTILDSLSGIFYLSESVSRLYYDAPVYKEKMLSSRVSGSAQTYSFNQAPDVLINLYENLVNLIPLTPRGIVSPISGDALFFYNYRFERSFVENGISINEISVIPKRQNDPVFTGKIYITDDTWRIYSADVFITKNQQMEFVDTFNIKQNFVPLENDIWLPFSHQMSYTFSVFGFKGSGVVVGVFSDYALESKAEDSFARGEIFKIEKDANKKDSLYWNVTRPIPLTEAERIDYHKKDSTRIIRESKPYLDSIDRKNNKFAFNSIFSGYTWQNSYNKKSIHIYSPAQDFYFNTVEGWNARLNIIYEKQFGESDYRSIKVHPYLRYGFSNKRWNGNISYEYLYNTHKLAVFQASAGTSVRQINDRNPISDMTNTIYGLWGEKNYMKLYENRYANVNHKFEIANGIGLGINAEYSRRLPLTNTSDYKFKDIPGRVYESNNPLNPQVDTPAFQAHNAFIVEGVLAIKPGMQYANRPEGKFNLGTKYPVLRLYYTKGIAALGSAVNFDMYRVTLSDEIRLGLLGRFSYLAAYGDFLQSKKLYFMDYRHFSGNRTFFSQFRLDDFRNLEYYRYSTTSAFFEGHAEYNMGGFILNKIPLIRKLKLQEVLTMHVLETKDVKRLIQVTAGVEKLNLLRFEMVSSVTNGRIGTIGFVFGIKRTFGL